VNEELIARIVPELRRELGGLHLREIFQLTGMQFAIAFEGGFFKLLFIAIEPRDPRTYMIKRRVRDLKKVKQNPSKFAIDAEKALSGKQLYEISKYEGDRIVEFGFRSDEIKFLVAQLTGKSSNLFLLDEKRIITAAARKPTDEQSIGIKYSPPTRTIEQNDSASNFPPSVGSASLSEALDSYYLGRDEKERFDALAGAARKKRRTARERLLRLIRNLEADLEQHGDAEKWKRYGDLLLANQAQADRQGGSFVVGDLYDEAAPLIEIEADENDSISEAAQRYFRKYSKARNAAAEVAARIQTVRSQLAKAEMDLQRVEEAILDGDTAVLVAEAGIRGGSQPEKRRPKADRLPVGIRSFRSSDGFEVLVGKKATDNDLLTFRIANSRDTWMHAADYPGSHVVIRNPDRREIPQKTLSEAAQLAAFYSQGKKQVKAAVNYTEKKFVSKPKGAAPGLVRLSSFRTLLVDPIFPEALQT
jgi:predicted ribosome quality control (RQC) complex YloA/Tae2 family protein